MPEEVVNLKDVAVAYDNRIILKEVNLKVLSGEAIGLWGPNGAGKTSLLKVIGGLLKAAAGTVELFGEKLSWQSGNRLRRNIGYVPQFLEVEPEIPVLVEEVVMMGRYGQIGLFRFPDAEDYLAVEEAARQLEIEGLLKRPFGQLSGGQKRRVLIARSLAQGARVLLLDEIFSWLDTRMKEKLLILWHQVIRGQKITSILVSHEAELLQSLCTRVIRMENGQLHQVS